MPHLTKKTLHAEANRHANFFKHADRDAESVLENFKAVDADSILFTAVFDFGKICGGKSIEAQVFEGWFLHMHGRDGDVPSALDELFPNLRALSRAEQLALGRKVLAWARTIRNFEMKYSLEVKVEQSSLDAR